MCCGQVYQFFWSSCAVDGLGCARGGYGAGRVLLQGLRGLKSESVQKGYQSDKWLPTRSTPVSATGGQSLFMCFGRGLSSMLVHLAAISAASLIPSLVRSSLLTFSE